MLAPMTAEDCIYQGGAPPAAGTFAVQVENHTVYCAHFLLASAPGVSRAKVASFLTSVSPGVPLAFYGVTLPER